jgi:hypothetical protein
MLETAVIAVVAVAVGGGVYLYKKRFGKKKNNELIENPVGLEHAVNDLIENHGYNREDAIAIAGNWGKGIQKGPKPKLPKKVRKVQAEIIS